MFNKMLMAAMASTALASAPLLAAPGGGHGPADVHSNAGGNSGGGAGALSGPAGGPAGAALDARMNSMGSANASPTGIANANANSALNSTTGTTIRTNSAAADRMFPGTKTTTTVQSGSLSGLTTGMTLTSNGTTVGTVQQIRTSTNGRVSVVLVQGTNGRMFAIPAGKLSLVNGTLTTTARLNGINGGINTALAVSQGPMHASATGIARSSPHSVLAAGAVAATALPGLTTGVTVRSSTGATLGTVSQVVTDSSGNIRLVIVTSPTGGTLRLMPRTLTMESGILTTTQSS